LAPPGANHTGKGEGVGGGTRGHGGKRQNDISLEAATGAPEKETNTGVGYGTRETPIGEPQRNSGQRHKGLEDRSNGQRGREEGG
jgi:hypothetical protein